MISDTHRLTARQIAAHVRSGAISALEAVNAFSDQVTAHNQSLNALRFYNLKDARKQAKLIDASQGHSPGRLVGVPFSAKDHINVAGLPRSAGTLLGAVDVCANDAMIARLVLQEGAICIGKANMAEYGKSYFTDNAAFGRSLNPFNPDHTPGGSGGGDAAAVAAGMACFGLGADSGGSVRVPANFCGLFGLLPSPGLISSSGLSAYAHTTRTLFRSPGPITRSIDDLELLTDILVTFDQNDPRSVFYPPQKLITPNNRQHRVAIVECINGVSIDPEIQTALNRTEHILRKLGATPTRVSLPHFDRCYEPFIILAGQAALIIEDIVAYQQGLNREPDKESSALKNLRKRIASELPTLTVESLLTCWHAVDALRNSLADLFQQYDFILSPVSAILPPRHDSSTFKVDGKEYETQEVFQYASTANVLGLPALAFPTHLADNGLPVGLQLMGPRYSDFDLIKLIRDLGFVSCIPCTP